MVGSLLISRSKRPESTFSNGSPTSFGFALRLWRIAVGDRLLCGVVEGVISLPLGGWRHNESPPTALL